jgi:hypothetical protein
MSDYYFSNSRGSSSNQEQSQAFKRGQKQYRRWGYLQCQGERQQQQQEQA